MNRYGTYRGPEAMLQMQKDLAGGGVYKGARIKKVSVQSMSRQCGEDFDYREMLSNETLMRLEAVENGRAPKEIP